MDDDAERIGYIGCRPILVFVVHCGIEWVLKVPVTDERNSQTRYMSVYFQSSKWFWFEFQPVNQPKYVSLGRASCLVNKHTHTLKYQQVGFLLRKNVQNSQISSSCFFGNL